MPDEVELVQMALGSNLCGITRDGDLRCYPAYEGVEPLDVPPGRYTQLSLTTDDYAGADYACAA